MKKASMAKIILAAGFAAAGIYAAEQIAGDYNTSLGYLAGKDASGDRTTVQGAGAGGEAENLVRTDLIGAAAGVWSTNLTDCVAIGYRALRQSRDMEKVVAIGAGALSNRSGIVKTTWLNGQFYASAQGNAFWLKPNPDMPDTNAPIHYADGVLCLNASTIRFNGEATSGGGGESGPILLGYDMYVDPVNGDDLYAGTSPSSAKRTIDAALELPGTNVCLLAGEHAAPTNEAMVAHRFFAPYGKDRTCIVGHAGANGFQVSYIENCTLTNLAATHNGYPAFAGTASNCVMHLKVKKTAAIGLLSSTVRDCDVSCMWASSVNQGSRGMFIGVNAYDSLFRLFSSNACTISIQTLDASTLENCVLIATNVGKFVYTGSMTFLNSTVLCPSASEWGSASAYNSLFGCGEGACIWNVGGTNNICAAYSEMQSAIEADYRPSITNWRYRYNGYRSAPERAVRDSMLNSIREALSQAGGE